jgi:hypothetical protein
MPTAFVTRERVPSFRFEFGYVAVFLLLSGLLLRRRDVT